MQIAILTVSSLSLIASVGTLAVMVKVAKELKTAKAEVETNVEVFKAKTDRNLARIKRTMSELEL